MNKPRGLVLGWYNQLNAGDDRLCQCITSWLHDHTLTFMRHTEPPTLASLDHFDYVLLGGGSIANSVSGAFRNMRNWVVPCGLPVFAVGIGVSHHPEFEHEFRSIPESGGHVWVRDANSKVNTRLRDSEVDVAPDLSWMYPIRECPLQRDGFAINLRPGGGPRTLQLSPWKQTLNMLENAWPWPLCFGKDDDRPVLSAMLDVDITDQEFDFTAPSRAEMVIAMRFHAIIFAIQTGTPFVAITHTKKLEYLLQDLDLSYATVPHDAPEEFPDTVAYVRAHMRREELLSITEENKKKTRGYAATFKRRIEKAVENNNRRTSLLYRSRRKLRSLVCNA